MLLDLKAQVAGNYGVRGTPAHLLLNHEGKMIAGSPGFVNWKEKKAQRLIQSMIDKNKIE